MKMRKLLLFFIVISLACVFAACDFTDKNEIDEIKERGVLKVGVKQDVPGFGYKNPDTGELEGFEIDLAKRIALDLLGDESKIELIPVTTATRGELLNSGELDLVIATFTITDERRELFYFSIPYYTDAIGLMVKKDSGFQRLEDMGGTVIGVVGSATAASAIASAAEETGVQVDFLEYPAYPDLKSAFDAGEVDCFGADKSILAGYLDSNTKVLAEGHSPQDYGAAARLTNEALGEYVDNLIAKWIQDGTISQLLARHAMKS